jgi:hypothetical protein
MQLAFGVIGIERHGSRWAALDIFIIAFVTPLLRRIREYLRKNTPICDRNHSQESFGEVAIGIPRNARDPRNLHYYEVLRLGMVHYDG